MATPPSFTIAVAEELLEYAARTGLDVLRLRQGLGLVGPGAPPVDARLSAPALLHLWDELPRISADPDFGLSFASWIAKPTSNLGTLLVASARTLREGITRFVSNELAFNSLLPTVLETDRREARIVLDPALAAVDLPLSRHVVEAVVAWWWTMIGHGLSSSRAARRVEFIHASPGDTSAHRNTFGVDPHFARPRNVLAFDAELLDRPLSTGSAQLRLVAEHAAQQLAEAIPHQSEDPVASIREQIARAIARGETPNQAKVAGTMGVSVRTLQRTLASGETSFSTLYDEARCVESQRLLQQTSLPIQEVARRLGYYDAAGFFRAFKRWMGMTPGDFRRRGPHEPGASDEAP